MSLSWVRSDQLYQTFFNINIDEDDIDSDLLYAGTADHIFMVPAKNTPYLTRPWDDDMCDMTGTNVKFNIADITKPDAIPAVNDFFFPKFTNAHIITFDHLL
jgi:hypothetical protein